MAEVKVNKEPGARLYLVMFVKDALEKKVGLVVELCAAVWGNFQPKGEIL